LASTSSTTIPTAADRSPRCPGRSAASDVGLEGSAAGSYDLYQPKLSGVRLAAVAGSADAFLI